MLNVLYVYNVNKHRLRDECPLLVYTVNYQVHTVRKPPCADQFFQSSAQTALIALKRQ